ncbi:MAG: BatD family protein, partial [Gammaproteobacteria bacterium]|nr:BatD family protein [Gammaproteobacteria bacterium]
MVIRHFLLLIAFSFFSNIAFANVSATVDRMVIEEGETFVLTVRSDSASPDLDVLEQFFNVLGTSRSSKVSIVNGSMTSVKEWIVTLSPKKTGITVIPGITVGNEKTAPIKVQVVKAKSISAAQGADI